MNNRINQEEFKSYPKFENREEAEKWLKEKYGEDFIFSEEREFQKKPLYCYIYILNIEVFDRMQEYIRRTGSRTILTWEPETKGFADSYQEILIWGDGKVQVQSLAM
ncbi:hypothetical protein [Bacillus paramycoides]|uniref:hypothetical protein n=1 Tax=Bacillus paramycoides TaxID=2026194 RepID=UPI002E1B7FEB|nr:hypothetical protein [Bacillus paramycoides]